MQTVRRFSPLFRPFRLHAQAQAILPPMLQNAKQSNDLLKFYIADSRVAPPICPGQISCTGSRKSHPTPLIHAPCALIRINSTHRRPPGPHHKDPPRDLESSSHQPRSAHISSHHLTSAQRRSAKISYELLLTTTSYY